MTEKVLSKDELVVKVLYLAYLVQVKTDYGVFVNYSGHVDQLSIRIVASKERWQCPVLESEMYLAYEHWRHSAEPVEAALRAKINVLEEVLRTGKVPYDDLDYEEIVYREYSF